MKTTAVGIREAKTNLSKLVKLVRNGSEIMLTDRGKPVCKIVPIVPQALSLRERIERLEDRGIIERSSDDRIKKVPPPLPLKWGLAQKRLQEDRNHGG